MHQSRLQIALVAIIVILGIGLYFVWPQGPASVIGDDAYIYRLIESEAGFTDRAHLRIPYTYSSTHERYHFINVAVDLNGDGVIAPYDVDGATQEEWVVRDMFARPNVDASNRYLISLVDGDAMARLPLAAKAIFAAEPIDAETWPEETGRRMHAEDFEIADIKTDDRLMLRTASDDPTLQTGPGGAIAASLVRPAHAGARQPLPEVPPAGWHAESTGMPDTDQGFNECNPTGISNGLSWLAKEHGFEDLMPPDTGSLIDELKGDVGWSETGVGPGDAIPGKRSFIERRGLPLEAHLVSETEFDMDIMYKIAREMRRGQAVEIGIQFYDENGDMDGAHLVTVGGVDRFEHSGSQFISLVDPATASEPGDNGLDVYRWNDNGIENYHQGGTARIRWAYAQSPVFDDSGALVFPDGMSDPKDFVLTPDTELTPAGGDIAVSRSKFDFFTVGVDHPGDHLVGESFTVRAVVRKVGDEFEISYWDPADETVKDYTHGVAVPWRLDGEFDAGGPVAPARIGDRPPTTSIGTDSFEVSETFTCTEAGRAVVTYTANISWDRTGGDVPQPIMDRRGAEMAPADTLRIQSPPFRCIAPPPEPEEDEGTGTAGETAFACPGIDGITEGGHEVDVLEYQGECWPSVQFRIAGADACESDHWHAAGPVVSLSGSTTTDPLPGNCGFGKVAEVPVHTVRLTPDEQTRILGGLLAD